MELKYNLNLYLNDYLDKLKETIFINKKLLNTEFYKNKTTVLSKILFLAWQKKLVIEELFDLLNYIPTNDRVLQLVYEYRGVCNRSIILQALSIVWQINSIETLENEIKIDIQSPHQTEVGVFRSELNDDGSTIELLYKEEPLTLLQAGNQSTSSIISFIKLFLPVGVYLNITYTHSVDTKTIENSGAGYIGANLGLLNIINKK